jgi:hypothetical protein
MHGEERRHWMRRKQPPGVPKHIKLHSAGNRVSEGGENARIENASAKKSIAISRAHLVEAKFSCQRDAELGDASVEAIVASEEGRVALQALVLHGSEGFS